MALLCICRIRMRRFSVSENVVIVCLALILFHLMHLENLNEDFLNESWAGYLPMNQ